MLQVEVFYNAFLLCVLLVRKDLVADLLRNQGLLFLCCILTEITALMLCRIGSFSEAQTSVQTYLDASSEVSQGPGPESPFTIAERHQVVGSCLRDSETGVGFNATLLRPQSWEDAGLAMSALGIWRVS